jgi:hypothetical protein
LIGPNARVDEVECDGVHVGTRDILVFEVELDVGSDELVGYRDRQLEAPRLSELELIARVEQEPDLCEEHFVAVEDVKRLGNRLGHGNLPENQISYNYNPIATQSKANGSPTCKFPSFLTLSGSSGVTLKRIFLSLSDRGSS